MLITKKMLIALTLVGALLGAGIGSLITHSASSTQAANSYDRFATVPASNTTANSPDQIETANASLFSTTAEQAAYRQGFEQGFGACDSARTNTRSRTLASNYTTYRAPVRRYSGSRTSRTYYDYNTAPRGRSFWQKHRDKLTLAIGTGAGAAIGGLAGGKKGAGIGSLIGLGGSALYTYKLRKRSPRY
ncbi:MAG TPA: hypothetical protein VIU65_07620 [Pyrinomonadaceae bacterium]